MKPSIIEAMRSIQRLPLRDQHERLGVLLAKEPQRSILRAQIETARHQIVMRDLKAGNRGIRRAS